MPGMIVIPPGPRLGIKQQQCLSEFVDFEMTGNVVIEGKNLTKQYGNKVLMKDFSFRIEPATIVGVVGPNGCGKTTLFNIISGFDKPDSGSISLGSSVFSFFVSFHV